MKNSEPQVEGCHGKRTTLSIMGFIGLALMYSLRFNLSIGIVAMVDHPEDHPHVNQADTQSNSTICPALISPLNETDTAANPVMTGQSGDSELIKFNWDEKEQGLILGSFFWGYMASQLPGGILAQRVGGKWVISLGLLITGLLSLILPWAAMTGGINALLTIRVLQGLSEGVVFPAFTVLLAKWTPPAERASISTLSYSGMPFGTALTMIVSGNLISSFGWPAVFYAPGILTIVWFLAWTFLVYSSPKGHPTISASERNYLESSNKESHSEENVGLFDIPWKSIIFSLPVWAILLSHFANTWGHNTLKSEGPKYLHSVLHFDIHQNAYTAAVPYLFQMVVCNVIVRISDYCISKNWLSLSSARRLCNTIGQTGTGLAYLGLILADCNRSLAVIFYILSGTFNGAVYGGFVVNPIDIAPNYAGAIEGLINGISNLAGFGALYVAGLILNADPSMHGWMCVFLIPVIGDLVGNLCFVLFCSTKVQPWNNQKEMKKDLENH